MEPLSADHGADLAIAVQEERSAYGFTNVPEVSEVSAFLAAHRERAATGRMAAKLLLFEHAFEIWEVARVDLKTDARNQRSRHAIAGLGARFEGVLRNWSPSHAPGETGQLRDSAIFSIIAAEWPAAKAALRQRLSDGAPARTATVAGRAGSPISRRPPGGEFSTDL